MRTVAYCRVSTDKEDQQNSLEAQKEFFSKYTDHSGDTLLQIYADEGLSGTRIKNRTEFQRMMADAEQGKFDKIVTKDVSRFARNTVDVLNAVRRLKQLDIRLYFLTDEKTAMDGDSEFILTLRAALAQEESNNLSKRVKWGKKQNAKKGKVPNYVYGYDKTEGNCFELTINTAEAAVVRQVYDLYTHDGYGAWKIANMLNGQGIRTKRGCRWSQNAVCRILTNELYTGKLINGKQESAEIFSNRRRYIAREDWIVTERPSLKIIDRLQFEEAGRILRMRQESFKTEGKRHSNTFLLSTLVRCGECGRSFRRTVHTYKNTYVRWECPGHTGHGEENCSNKVKVDEEELVGALNDYFADFVRKKKDFIPYATKEFEKCYSTQDGNAGYRKELERKIRKLERCRQKQMEMYEDDLLSREELNKKIGGIRQELERLSGELERVERGMANTDQISAVLGEVFSHAEAVSDVRQMTGAQLKQIVDRIEVGPNGTVDIYLKLQSESGKNNT